jgi:DNA-directed RNA polymerase subunit M/transcription elongation factor TFIIS
MNQQRQRILAHFVTRFQRLPEFAKYAKPLAANIEKSLFNKAIDNSEQRFDRQKYRKAFIHVDFITYSGKYHRYAQGVRDAILKKQLQIQNLVNLSRRELDYVGYYEIIQRVHETYMRTRTHNLMGEEYAKMARERQGVFPCSRCKSTKTNYVQVQTRSADEGMTVMVKCENCDHSWKFS